MAIKEQDQQLNVQPQSIEAEQAVLGSMLASKDAISKALQWVRSHHFYKEAHGKIYLVMTDLFDKGEPIDTCLLYTSPSPRDRSLSRMPSSA